MSISQDGNDLVWDGSVRITNAFDITTGVATCVFTPTGGVGTLPVMSDGGPGLPPIIDAVIIHEVTAGHTLPNSTFSLVDPGGPGQSSQYTFDLYIHAGATGDPGPSTTISSAPDVEGTVADGLILVYSAADSKWKMSAQKVGDIYIPGSITDTSGSGGSRTLCQVVIPAQSFDWHPLVFGQCIVTGTANTRVDLISRVNNSSTGDICGYGFGVAGTDRAYLMPSIPAGSGANVAKVAQGSPAVIYFLAVQQNSSVSDSWSTNHATSTFQVKVCPVQ